MGRGRLQTGVGVISWPWQPWLNSVVAWLVSQSPFLPLRKGTAFYLLASESVRRQIQKGLQTTVWQQKTSLGECEENFVILSKQRELARVLTAHGRQRAPETPWPKSWQKLWRTLNVEMANSFTSIHIPGRSTWASRPHSSWHRHCQTLRSSWELRTGWRAASLRKTRSHLPPPEDRRGTVKTSHVCSSGVCARGLSWCLPGAPCI